MRKTHIALLSTLFALLTAAPAAAGGFGLYAGYWDTDASGEVLGGGARLGFGLVPGLDLDLRATYYEEATSDPFSALVDLDDPFEAGIQALPIDLGLRLYFSRARAGVRPYVGGGGTYYRLDSDFGEVDDEVGYYGLFGVEFGDQSGPRLFAEADYRTVEATVDVDPNEVRDIPELGLVDRVDVDLGGFGVNVGLAWSW